jgi:hypothetical protein
MFSNSSIKIEKKLLEKARSHAQQAGYSSVEEFVIHLIERELEKQSGSSAEEEEEMKNKLKGLGYIS